jgi:hypothetical protein
MKDELRLLRQAHEEQAKHVLTERVVVADRIRVVELRAEQLERRIEQLEREVTDAHANARREVANEHEKASRHVEAARAERDAAVRQLEDFQQTSTYRFVMLMHRVLSRGTGRSR